MRSILWFLVLILLLAGFLATACATALAAHADPAAIRTAGHAAGEHLALWHPAPPTIPQPRPILLLIPFVLG